MSDQYEWGRTYTVREFGSSDEFWEWVKTFPAGRRLRLHLLGGSTVDGEFIGAGDVTGFARAPEPDGMATIARPGSDDPINVLRAEIIAATPLA